MVCNAGTSHEIMGAGRPELAAPGVNRWIMARLVMIILAVLYYLLRMPRPPLPVMDLLKKGSLFKQQKSEG